MQPFWTEAYRPQARLGLRASVELVALFLQSMCWPAQVFPQTTGLRLLQGSKRQKPTLNCFAVAQRLLQAPLRYDIRTIAVAA